MRRKPLFLSPIFRILFWAGLFVSTAAGQTANIQQLLTGEWRGPDASFDGHKYSLTAVFAQGPEFRILISGNINLNEGIRSRFYTATDLKVSGKNFSFALKGTKLTVFYEGEYSPQDETLTMHFAYELPAEPGSRITWKLRKIPLCNDPEAMSVAATDLWENRGCRKC